MLLIVPSNTDFSLCISWSFVSLFVSESDSLSLIKLKA